MDPDALQEFFDREGIEINLTTHEGLENIVRMGYGGHGGYADERETGLMFGQLDMTDFSNGLVVKQMEVSVMAQILRGDQNFEGASILVRKKNEDTYRRLTYDTRTDEISLSEPVTELLKKPAEPGYFAGADERYQYEQDNARYEARMAFFSDPHNFRRPSDALVGNQADISADLDQRRADSAAALQNSLDTLTAQMDALYDRYESSHITRLDYVFIDGEPISSYFARYADDTDTSYRMDQRKNMVPALILSAQLQGRRVTAARLDEVEGLFRADQIEEIPMPEACRAALGNSKIAEQFRENALNTPMPIVSNRTREEADAEQARNSALLERRTVIDRGLQFNNNNVFLVKDLMRSIPNTDENGRVIEPQELLAGIGSSYTGISFQRYALTSHAVGLMVSRGISPDTIFDPQSGAEDRADAGRTVYDLARAKNIEEIIRINLEASQAIGDLLEKELSQLDLSDNDVLFGKKLSNLTALASMNFDLLQERDHFKEIAYGILARQQGLDYATPEGKKAAEDAYSELTDRAYGYSALGHMMNGEMVTIHGALGKLESEDLMYHDLPVMLSAECKRSMFIRAQRNGEPMYAAVSGAVANSGKDENAFLDDEVDDPKTRSAYENLQKDTGREAGMALARRILSPGFRENYDFRAAPDENGQARFMMHEKVPGASSAYDHAKKDDDFYSASFRLPDHTEANEQTVVNDMSLDRAVYMTLNNRFNIQLKDSGDRVFYLNDENQLVPLTAGNAVQYDQDLRARLRNLAVSNRLFAVNEQETTPTQLCFDRRNDEWECTAADCLDAPVEPVEYKWYHRLGNLLGIRSCVDRRKEYEMAQIRQQMQPSIARIKAEQAPNVTLERINARREAAGRQQVVDEQTRIETVHAQYAKSCESFRNIYGTHPYNYEGGLRMNSFTKAEFDELKPIELGLAGNDAPALDENGKLRFREDDFIGLAMSAATAPELGGSMFYGPDSETSDYIDARLLADHGSTMYLNDFAYQFDKESGLYFPRHNEGKYVVAAAVPGRERAAEAIREYRGGKPDKLADLVFTGLTFYSRCGRHQAGSPASDGIAYFMGRVGDLLEADPVLRQKVDERAATFRKNAEDELKQVRESGEQFRKEHMDYIRKTEQEITKLNKTVTEAEDRGDIAARNAAADQVHDFYENKNPQYDRLIQENVLFGVREKYAESNSRFSVDLTLKRIRTDKMIRSATDRAENAIARISTAALEKKPIPREEKAALMHDIYFAQVLQHNENVMFDEATAKGHAASKDPDYARLTKGPAMRAYDPALLAKDHLASNRRVSPSSCAISTIKNANLTNRFSKVTEELLDPSKSEQSFRALYDRIAPQNGRFQDMSTDVLLREAKAAGENVRKFVVAGVKEQQEQQRRMEVQKNAQKSADKNADMNKQAEQGPKKD